MSEQGNAQNYLETAARDVYTPGNDKFFGQNDLTHSIGTDCVCRLGFDDLQQCFKVYVRKSYPNFSPTVLHFIAKEIPEILKFVKKTMDTIDSQPVFVDKINPKDSGFWGDPSVFTTTSKTARMRMIRGRYSRLQMHLNSPILEESRFANYIGPLIFWTRDETLNFVTIMENLMKKFEISEL